MPEVAAHTSNWGFIHSVWCGDVDLVSPRARDIREAQAMVTWCCFAWFDRGPACPMEVRLGFPVSA